MQTPSLPIKLIEITHAIRDAGGRALVVGGAVRDHLRNQLLAKDLDIEVFGLEAKVLENILSKSGKVLYIGKSFGIFKLHTPEAEYDFSLPRLERKSGAGHRNFHITTDPNLEFQRAAYRRDFTINSIGFDPLSGQYLDPYGGQEDLRRRTIRHVGSAFDEDPLRVLRAVQFSGRFGFRVAPETARVCRMLKLEELPQERIFDEFRKLLLLSPSPSVGLETARNLGVLNYFPELRSTIGVPQEPSWHQEGDLWTHTLRVVDAASELKKGTVEFDMHLMFAVLCLNFGKVVTTTRSIKHWLSPAHYKGGYLLTRSFMQRLTREKKLIDIVSLLVREQLRPQQIYKDCALVHPATIRRLALLVPIELLVRVAHAQYLGKIDPETTARDFPAGDWLLEKAHSLSVNQQHPTQILLGRHLLELGMQEGPPMGRMLKKAFEAQLNGKFETLEEAKRWVLARLSYETLETQA